MKTIRLLGFVLVVVFAIVSCKKSANTEKNTTALHIPKFNIEKALEEDVTKSCYGEVKVTFIIPLETSEKALLGEVRKVMKSGDLLFVLDTNSSLKIFNTKGEFQRNIGRVGQGPGEYVMLTDFTLDDKHKRIYINSLEKFLVYDFDGNFKKEVPFEEKGKYQVFTFCNDKLFYIVPDVQYSDDVESATLVAIFDTKGKLVKQIPANKLRRKQGFAMFNNIATDGKNVFYKEEFGQTVYAIQNDYSIDKLCVLDFGKYTLQTDELSMDKQKYWEKRCRLQNILPAADYSIFIVQKGLLNPEFIPFLWNKKDDSFCRFDYKVSYNGTQYSVLPFAISENKIVGILNDTDGELEEQNPILVILELK